MSSPRTSSIWPDGWDANDNNPNNDIAVIPIAGPETVAALELGEVDGRPGRRVRVRIR